MAHIMEHRRKDGSIAYLAQITLKRKGKWVHRETHSFDRKTAASAWLKTRMRDIEAAGEDPSSIRNRGRTLADAIGRYTRESVKEVGRTKAQGLRAILEYDIADMVCSDIQSHDIVAFAKEIGTTRTPSTVSNYLSHLGAIFAIARPAWDMELYQQAMKDAFVVCNRLGITGKDRRPTLDELDALLAFFEEKHATAPARYPCTALWASPCSRPGGRKKSRGSHGMGWIRITAESSSPT
ncbi:MAG: hypothetical protein AAF982_04790 [Pseudomonadota bacterium]